MGRSYTEEELYEWDMREFKVQTDYTQKEGHHSLRMVLLWEGRDTSLMPGKKSNFWRKVLPLKVPARLIELPPLNHFNFTRAVVLLKGLDWVHFCLIGFPILYFMLGGAAETLSSL